MFVVGDSWWIFLIVRDPIWWKQNATRKKSWTYLWKLFKMCFGSKGVPFSRWNDVLFWNRLPGIRLALGLYNHISWYRTWVVWTPWVYLAVNRKSDPMHRVPVAAPFPHPLWMVPFHEPSWACHFFICWAVKRFFFNQTTAFWCMKGGECNVRESRLQYMAWICFGLVN